MRSANLVIYVVLEKGTLAFFELDLNLGPELRDPVLNVPHQDAIQLGRQKGSSNPCGAMGAVLGSQDPVHRMAFKVLHFVAKGRLDCLLVGNVLLGTTNNPDKTVLQAERSPVLQYVQGICAGIHQVQLCEHTNRPIAYVQNDGQIQASKSRTVGIDLPSKLEGLRVNDVHVGRRDSQY
jgi:hypothetical protein